MPLWKGRREARAKELYAFFPAAACRQTDPPQATKKWRLSLEAFALIRSMPNPSLGINHIWSNLLIERHLERPRKNRKKGQLENTKSSFFSLAHAKKHFRH